MKQFLKTAAIPMLPILFILTVFAVVTFLPVYIPVNADVGVEYSDINLVNDPYSHSRRGVFQGSVTGQDCSISLCVGESPWLNPWDTFELWYQVESTATGEYAVFPLDYWTYTYTDLVYDRMGHPDTFQSYMTSCVQGGEWILIVEDIWGM